ncbi:MAG: HAD-IA family hydrolase [Candidatus Pacebacteria bacterium]|nr:HAD-IA family hydrolase [Candidatus Paceibacterota bacterium]
MSKYKGIGFDYGGVIAGNPGSVFVEAVSQFLGVTKEDFNKTYFKYNQLFNNGKIDIYNLYELIIADLGVSASVDEVIEFGKNFKSDYINEDVVDLIKKLRVNYKIGLLSNNTIENANAIKATGINRLFDAFIISEEIGFSKPSQEAFDIFFKALDTLPKETIFIDDSMQSLSKAEEIGYEPVLFESFEKLTNDLEKLGIKI